MSAFIEENTSSRNWGKLLMWLIVLVHLAVCIWASNAFAPTQDEIDRLDSGLLILRQGDFRTESTPPLTKILAAFPLWVQGQEFDAQSLYESLSQSTAAPQTRLNLWNDPQWRPVFIARCFLVPLSLIGLFYVFLWARELFGGTAGIVAATLWASFPGVVGYSGTVGPHVAAAGLGVATMYYLRSWLLEPTLPSAAIFGAVSGLAVLTKQLWISAYLIGPVMWLLYLMIFQAGHWGLWRLLGQAVQLLLALLVSLAVVNLGYGLQGSLRPLREYEFQSELLMSKPVDDHFGYPGKKLGSIIVALPEPYVMMLDQWWQNRSQQQPILSIEDDDEVLSRIWYAGAPFAIRIPLPLIALGVLALSWYLRNTHFLVNDGHTASLLLLIPAAALATWVLLCSTFTDALADGLVCVPFLLIWVSVPWYDAGDFPMSRIPRWTGYILLAGYLFSVMHILPYSRWYVNYIVGGPQNQHQFLHEKDSDWGDDLLALRDWMARQPHVSQISIAYDGFLDPQLFEFSPFPAEETQESLRPGWYALSEQFVPQSEFAEQKPVSIGRTLKLFEIADPDAGENSPPGVDRDAEPPLTEPVPTPTPDTDDEVPELRA